jgi:hypothetical protein
MEAKRFVAQKKGLGQIYKACESLGFPKPMVLHSTIHQQALCGELWIYFVCDVPCGICREFCMLTST